jgi:hypothetical protein
MGLNPVAAVLIGEDSECSTEISTSGESAYYGRTRTNYRTTECVENYEKVEDGK